MVFGVCVRVCTTNFNIGNNFLTSGSRALIFHLHVWILCGKSFSNIQK